MTQAQAGHKVRVHYTGTLDDGSVFDSSRDGEPLHFTLGSGEVILGFDKGVTGLSVNETRTVRIPAVEAYGPRQAQLVVEIPRKDIPPHLKLKKGQHVQMKGPGGAALTVVVVAESEESLTFDGNHPLAGKDLTFELTLVEIMA